MESEVKSLQCEHKRQGQLEGPFGVHHAKTVCRDCLKFISWVAAPKTVEGQAERLETIMLLERGELTDWEKGFIDSIKRAKSPSPKQLEWFGKIRDKYLKAGVVIAAVPAQPEEFGVPF